MAIPFSNATENPLTFNKCDKNTPISNLKSFWASLLFIFIYISVFYVFNLSPSTLLSTTTFWFFVSNTLIFIIVVDFGDYSSSKQHELCKEYGKINISPKSVPSFETEYKKIAEETQDHREEAEKIPREKIIDMVVPTAPGDHLQNRAQEEEADKKPQEQIIDMIVPVADPDQDLQNHDTPKEFKKNKIEMICHNSDSENGDPDRVKRKKPKCARSNSVIVPENEEKMVMQRTLSERHCEELQLEENEFSSMSNEELNKRVEEFIRRFNREIRLQAAMERIQPRAEPCFEYHTVSCSLGYS